MDLSEVPAGDFLRHPWELARGRFFLDELRRAGLLSLNCRILDVGAGDAWFAKQVVEQGAPTQMVCWDLGYGERTPAPAEHVDYTATKPPGTFDGILLLDVTEHVPDDRAFLRDVLECARPGATVIFSVPAWPRLYSKHDEALRHYRRYHPAQALELLEECGLEVATSGGLFHSLLLPRVASVALERREPGVTFDENAPPVPDDLAWHGGKLLRSAVLGGLAIDRWLTRAATKAGVALPGLSFWAVARVPEQGPS